MSLTQDVPLLSVEGLTKRFGGITVADGLNLWLRSGEIRCIIGPNGAGKTSFFNMVNGFIRPDSGAMSFNGAPIAHLSPDRRAHLGIARSFQRPQAFLESSVWENVHIAAQRRVETVHPLARLKSLPGLDDVAEGALRQVWLMESAHKQASELSHGEKKRLDIGMALATNPRLLLLDEPTAGMTIRETADMAELVSRLTPKVTVLVIEHDMAFVRQIADRVTVFHRGEVLIEGSLAEVERDLRVQEIYLGSEHGT